MKALIILTLLLSSTSSFAEVHFLSLIENDNNPEIFTLSIETNNNGHFIKLIQTRYKNREQFDKNTALEIIKFGKQQLKEGVILYKQQGFDIIRMQAETIDIKKGGTARMFYKSNVLTQRSWKRNRSQLLQVINVGGSWHAAQKSGARLNYTFFRSGKLGIKSINYQYRPEFDF